MTVGHDCGDQKCAWSRYIVPFLRRARPAWRVRLVNVARGAWGVRQFADVPGAWDAAKGADVFLVDTSINAQKPGASSSEVMDRLLWRLLHERASSISPLPPAVLYIQAFRTCHYKLSDCVMHCGPDHPTFSFSLAPRGARLGWCPHWWSMGDAEVRTARHYGLPVASYRDAVWPVEAAPPGDLALLWEGLSHPTATTHEIFADCVKSALARLLLSPTLHDAAAPRNDGARTAPLVPLFPETANNPTCAHRPLGPLTAIRAADDGQALGPAPIAMSGSWRFFADRPHKFGWIYESGPRNASMSAARASITFPVVFSGAPRLEIFVLRSYVGFVDARVTLSGCPCGIDARSREEVPALQGSWTGHFSIPDSVTWTAKGGEGWREHASGGFAGRAFSEDCVFRPGELQNLTISTVLPRPPREASKFKIVAVTTC